MLFICWVLSTDFKYIGYVFLFYAYAFTIFITYSIEDNTSVTKINVIFYTTIC